jgi:hypothetical protein
MSVLATILGDDTGITVGLASGLVVVTLAWGEARVHIASLREWRREAEVKIASQANQLSAMEVRESRTVARLDHLSLQNERIEKKLDRLLERRDVA